MSRGQGLDHTQEYQWVKQPNGRYTIFDVPIFAAFSDEKRGVVDEDDLSNVVRNFQYDKMENFRYPRIHIGHHNGNVNRPGAGYLDNLKLQNNTIYADLVEIVPEVFQQMRNKQKFPYVSAEYHPNKKKILTLAFLESQTPFFDFPLINLESKPATMMSFDFGFPALKLQEAPEDISQFQDTQAVWACRDTVLRFQEHFQEGCSCMEDTEKKPEDTNPLGDEKKPMTEEAPQPYKCQDDVVGMKDILMRLMAKVEQIFAWEQSEHEGMEGDDMGEEGMMPDEGMGEEAPPEAPAPDEDFSLTGSEPKPSLPMKGEKNPMKKPSSVAFQATPELMLAIQQLSQIQRDVVKRLDRLENSQNFSADEAKLKRLCEDNGLNFQEQTSVLRKFSSSRDRDNYMASLAMLKPAARHPAGAMALPAGSMMITPADKVMQKFQDSHEQIRQAARDAYDAYRLAVEQPDKDAAQRFQRTWGSVERFVNYIAEQYPSDSQVLTRITKS